MFRGASSAGHYVPGRGPSRGRARRGHARRFRLSPVRDRRWPLILTGLVLLLGLGVAPRVFHHYDVVECFLPWSRASEGVRPWDVYTPGAGADDCDYPPLVPYLLTAAEAGRRARR